MTEKRQFKAIKGTRDILPPDSTLWNWFEHTARDVFESYNFRDIRLPVIEEAQLFARSVGIDTDIVSKEMFTFQDRPFGLEGPKNFNDLDRYIKEIEELLSSGQIPNAKTIALPWVC